MLLAEARRAGLLPRIAVHCRDWVLSSALPTRVLRQLEAALVQEAAFRRDVRRELGHVELALARLDTPVLLLKGASYVASNLPVAEGRVFSDIDLLVAKERLASAESELMLYGWMAGPIDAYDERYYRRWAHEVPPKTHTKRGTTIDLHHSLVMPTCRVKVNSAEMIDSAIPIGDGCRWWRLRDEDLVLHSAAHLLLNGEFERGLRDLWDLDLLIRHFSSINDGFTKSLIQRSTVVGLEALLADALWLSNYFFSTPIPEIYRSKKPRILTRLLKNALSPRHPVSRPNWQGVVDVALLVREVWLRFPPNLLVVHLFHKMKVALLPKMTVESQRL